MGSPDHPDQLLIALEPEAASIYCRRLKLNQLVPERPRTPFNEYKASPRHKHERKASDTMSTCSDYVMEDSGAGQQ